MHVFSNFLPIDQSIHLLFTSSFCLSVFVFLYCSLYNVHTTGKTPLQITQNALDAFAINSCIDAYATHDALDGGEEAIFYLKHEPNWTDQYLYYRVFELICRVEGGFDVPGND